MGTLWTATLLLAATAVNAPPAAPPAPLADMEVPAGEAATPPIVFNADQVRCQAANQSSIAKLFVHEAAELRREEQNRKHPEKSCCPDRVLLHLADARRGQDAAAALILAFKLVVIEQREQQLLRAQTRVSEWRAAIEKLSDTSGEQPDDAALQVQEDRLPDALTRLRSGREKLQLQLASMLNCSVEQARLIAINEPLDPMPGPVDAVAGTADAICSRAELKAIRHLYSCINKDNIDTVRKLIGAVQPGLGLSSLTPKGLLAKCGIITDSSTEEEIALRRRQCAELYASRERQVRTEVATAAVHLEECYARLRLAETLVQDTQRRKTDRSTLNKLDLSGGAAVIRTELESFAAEDALWERRGDAREAEILWVLALGHIVDGCPPMCVAN